MEIVYLFIGWLLGILSPILADRVKRKYTRNDLYTVLLRELDEVQYRLVCTSYLLGSRFGRFDREFLTWCKEMYQHYQGNEDKATSIQGINLILNMTDEQIKEYIRSERSDPNKGLGLKKTILTFLELNLAEISVFTSQFQNLLFELRAVVVNLNQEIDKLEKLHFMTFDSSITSENHARIRTEIRNKYTIIQDMSNITIDKIDKIKKYKDY